jgi:hypothetical protein
MIFIIVCVILIRVSTTGIPDIAVVTLPNYMKIDSYAFLFQDTSKYLYYGEGIMKVSERNKLAGIYEVDDNYFQLNHIKINNWAVNTKKGEQFLNCLISKQAAIHLFGGITPITSDIMIGDTSMKVAGIFEMPTGSSNLVHEETIFILGDISSVFQLKQTAYVGLVNKKTQNLIAPTIESMIGGAAVNHIYQHKYLLLFWIDLLLIVYGLYIISMFINTFFQKLIKKSFIPIIRTIGVTLVIFGSFYFIIRRGTYIDARIIPERFFSIKDWMKMYNSYSIEQKTLLNIPYFWHFTVQNTEKLIQILFIPFIMIAGIFNNKIQKINGKRIK